MGLIDDADSIINQEQQKKRMEEQTAERIKQIRTRPVDESQYILPIIGEAKDMLAEFVKVMYQFNVMPSPCVVANGRRTMSSSFFGSTFPSETITLSLAGFNAWCIYKTRYAVTDKGELALLMPLDEKEGCPNALMHEYFSGYALPEINRYGDTQVKKSIDTKALKGTSITVKKEILSRMNELQPTYTFHVFVDNRPALILRSLNVMSERERHAISLMKHFNSWDTSPIGAESYVYTYSDGYGEDYTTVNVSLKERLLSLIVNVKKGDLSWLK